MSLELLDASVVVLASSHNPTILHPVFLAGQGVVPKEWEVSQSPIVTPLVSQVTYNDRIELTCQPDKLVILDRRPPVPPTPSAIALVARLYVEQLPHVTYTALGLNFTLFRAETEPERFLIEHFLQPGPWNTAGADASLTGAAVSFVYELATGRLRISADAGRHLPTKRRGLLMRCNFHMAIPGGSPLVAVVQPIKSFPEYQALALRLAERALGSAHVTAKA